MSRVIKSIDLVPKRRKSFSNDSSFDVVFENSNRSQQNSVESRSQSIVDFSARADESVAIIEKSSKDKSSQYPQQRRNILCKPSQQPPRDAKMFLFIQMQLCRKDSLREWLRAHIPHRDTYQVLHMFNEIVRAVEYVSEILLIYNFLSS